jgi:hypothetical protein
MVGDTKISTLILNHQLEKIIKFECDFLLLPVIVLAKLRVSVLSLTLRKAPLVAT